MPSSGRWLLLSLSLALLLGSCSFGTADNSTGESAAGADALLDHRLVDVTSGQPFTLRELAADRPVIVETMAIWCVTCLRQQREVAAAHEAISFHSVGIDVEPNEDPDDLAAYAAGQGFDWRFAKADAELVRLLRDAFGTAVTNPPSTPTLIIWPDGTIRALAFGRVRSARELVQELGGA